MKEPTDSGVIPATFREELVEHLTRQTVWFTAPSGHRMRIRPRRADMWRARVAAWRERIGFAIAGYTPPEDW